MSPSFTDPHPNGKRGIKLSEFMGDPRLSKEQTKTFEAICSTDSEARIMGLDAKLRPVIKARAGIPQTTRKWALLRNGDPTDPGKITEEWFAPSPALTPRASVA